MLIRFEVENFRSIAREAELSMVAVDQDRDETVPVELLGRNLLKVAGIYGPNASGKSNIVAALAWLCDAVKMSLLLWDEGIPFDPFAFGSGPAEPSRFVIEMDVEGVRFEYSLEVDAEKIISEELYHYPKKIRRKIFERDKNDVVFQRGLGRLAGTKELLTDKTLVMSIAPRFDEPLVTDFAQQIRSIQVLDQGRVLSRRWGSFGQPIWKIPGTASTMRWFEDHRLNQSELSQKKTDSNVSRGDHRSKALSLLRMADLGIDDIRIEEEEIQHPGTSETTWRRNLRLLHRVSSTSAPLDYEEESRGTQTWFRLIGPILEALSSGSLVVIDELDANLHPALSAELIRIFHRPDTNPLGAQLLFTSHDTSLLNHLNRDEIWLTDKGSDGATSLGSLAEFAGKRVRKSLNLESGYLHGRFGALPQVDQLMLLRSLKLIG
jgi:predicted ATPase